MLISLLEEQLVLFDHSNNTVTIDVKMDGSVLEKKSSFKIIGLSFSSKLDWGSYIISIAKTASKKIGALIRSMKFLSPDVALYLYKSIIQSCMEYCCHVWAGAPSCYWELLDKLVPWEDIFKLSASAAAIEFCEWVQVGIDIYSPHRKYQVKPHSSPRFSAACAAAIAHKNHFFHLYQQNKTSESKVQTS